MIKEPRNRELNREDVYAEYFRRQMKGTEHITEEFHKHITEVAKYFKGKTTLELMIKGNIMFEKEYQKMFTFLNKTYKLTEVGSIEEINEGLEECLVDLDKFKAFMHGEPINWFSEIENEYVNYSRVLNAKIYMELN